MKVSIELNQSRMISGQDCLSIRRICMDSLPEERSLNRHSSDNQSDADLFTKRFMKWLKSKRQGSVLCMI